MDDKNALLLTTPKFLEVTRLTLRFWVSVSSMIFQTLTILSWPPVTKHPRMCGFTSIDEAAPSCAERVNFAGEGSLNFEGKFRTSKLRIRPFSSET